MRRLACDLSRWLDKAFFAHCDSTARMVPFHIVKRQNTFFSMGAYSILEGSVHFEKDNAHVSIGNRTFVGGGTVLMCAEKITIGDDVLVSFGVMIADHDSHSLRYAERANDVRAWYDGKKDWSSVKISPVSIGNKSWIGMHAIILEGVCVGEGAVVGAGSVVTRDVPPWTLVAGNPARVIKALEPGA